MVCVSCDGSHSIVLPQCSVGDAVVCIVCLRMCVCTQSSGGSDFETKLCVCVCVKQWHASLASVAGTTHSFQQPAAKPPSSGTPALPTCVWGTHPHMRKNPDLKAPKAKPTSRAHNVSDRACCCSQAEAGRQHIDTRHQGALRWPRLVHSCIHADRKVHCQRPEGNRTDQTNESATASQISSQHSSKSEQQRRSGGSSSAHANKHLLSASKQMRWRQVGSRQRACLRLARHSQP